MHLALCVDFVFSAFAAFHFNVQVHLINFLFLNFNIYFCCRTAFAFFVLL